MRYQNKKRGDAIRLGRDPRFGADVYGRSLASRKIKHDSQTTFTYHESEFFGVSQNGPVVESQLPELRRRYRELMRSAQQQGLTEVEINTLRSLLDAHKQSEIAELQGTSRQAIQSQLKGRLAPSGKRWGGLFRKYPPLEEYCKRAAEFRKRHGTFVHIAVDEEEEP